jgi:phosphopantothenoylcysteine decarboxylase/phosphopantothenate--cysteine ligase
MVNSQQVGSILYKKKIVLGVCGSIAAYKAAVLVRLLRKAGAEVRVILTPDATEFITPLTMATLSEHPVYSAFTTDAETGTWVNHVEQGLWGDALLVAPATSNTLAKMVSGACDNLLLATIQSARCPVMVAPAMDLDMYSHPASQANIEVLKQRGVTIFDSEVGALASGLEGKGRLAEPEHIVEALQNWFIQRAPLHGKHALVTAGPTYEPIDAVRFIGNHSSGKMGFAIAARLAELGAQVSLVSGPVNLVTPHPWVQRTNVMTAEEMHHACTERFEAADLVVMAAAVADYRPAVQAEAKIKKSTDAWHVDLVATTDILADLGRKKRAHQILVGFALETDHELEHAKGKLQRKNLDLIVLNSLNDQGAGFGHDTNKVTFIEKGNKISNFELKTKSDVAVDIVNKMIELWLLKN